MAIFKRRLLNQNAFMINGSNLERFNLFNKATKIMLIDPTVTGPSTTLTGEQKESISVTTSDNISVVAANYLNSSWTSAGWNVSSVSNLNSGLDTWAANNLAGDQNIVRMQGSINGNDYTLCFCYPGNQVEGVSAPAQLTEFWTMDEASGNALGGRGLYNLTQNGTVTRSTGKLGNCGNFSTNNYFTASSSIGGTTTFMVEFWYNQTVDANYYLINKYNGSNAGWWIRQINNHVTADGYNFTPLTSTNNPLGTGWHYYVFARRATSGTNESRLYLDGSLNAQVNGSSNSISAGSSLFVGADINGVSNTHKLDDVAFWADISGMSWTQIENIITLRWNSGVGMRYSI